MFVNLLPYREDHQPFLFVFMVSENLTGKVKHYNSGTEMQQRGHKGRFQEHGDLRENTF
jgi:hypothetical protein